MENFTRVHTIEILDAATGAVMSPTINDVGDGELETILGEVARELIAKGILPDGPPEGDVDSGFFSVPLNNGMEVQVSCKQTYLH